MFRDLVQHNPIAVRDKGADVRRRTLTLEKRVLLLEDELRATQDLVIKLVERLETHFGEDIDGDGNVGTASRPGHGPVGPP
jgi:hypothetical protein